jgi:hypothetical protein
MAVNELDDIYAERRDESAFEKGRLDNSSSDPGHDVSDSEGPWDPVVEAKARRK